MVVFAAGAGGKGDKSRTRKVDYEGAVKVYDAMESANCKKLILVGAVDIRDRESDVPGWYNDEDGRYLSASGTKGGSSSGRPEAYSHAPPGAYQVISSKRQVWDQS